MRKKPPQIVNILSRAIDEIRDEEMREDDERRDAERAKADRVTEDRDERQVRAMELLARSVERIANGLERMHTTGLNR